MKNKYGFVVLNYNNFKDTIECVESIQLINSNNYEIVVIDNCSTDKSYTHLENNLDRSIKLIKSEKNGGYSSGNNIGIKYFIDKGIENICIATNDTLIVSDDILSQVDNILLNEKNIGLIGPNILNLDANQKKDNPVMQNITLLYILNIHFPNLINYIRKIVYFILPIVKKFRFQTLKTEKESIFKIKDVYMIHGSFFIMTSNYIDKVGLLDESLFMYGEEDLLAFYSVSKNLRTIYVPNITIKHKSEGSTKEVHKNKLTSFRKRIEKESNLILRKKLNFFTLFYLLMKK